MDSENSRSVVLLSIHPQYVSKIFDGSKQVELRRVQLPKTIKYVVVYATTPVQRVIGFFEVGDVSTTTPESLWREFGHVAGVDRSEFFKYYTGAKSAVGIAVKRTYQLPNPIPLRSLNPDLTPPQGYRYLSSEVVATLFSMLKQNQKAA